MTDTPLLAYVITACMAACTLYTLATLILRGKAAIAKHLDDRRDRKTHDGLVANLNPAEYVTIEERQHNNETYFEVVLVSQDGIVWEYPPAKRPVIITHKTVLIKV